MANFPTSLDADSSLLVAVDFARSTLSGNMTNSQNTIPVVDGTQFPNPSGATWYVVINAADSTNREICGYTGITGNTLTGVTRAPFGPAAQTHTTGMTVELNIVSKFHEYVKQAVISLETKVGIDSSATTTTVDYKLSTIPAADKAVSKTGTETLTNKTLTAPIVGTSLTFSGASAKIVPSTTALLIRNNADAATNYTFSDAGDLTLSTGSLAITAGSISFSTAASKIVPGATSFSVRNNANNADNLILTDAGAATFRSTVGGITTLTATTLAGTLSTAAQGNVTSLGTLTSLTTSGTITMTATVSKIVPGATSFSHRNNADNADNLIITDAGAATFRSTVGGITTLTATTLAGTLSTAAQPNVTSLGSLTSLSLAGNVSFTANNADDIGTSAVGVRDLWVARAFQHLGIDQSPAYAMDW